METKVIEKIAKSGNVCYEYYIDGRLARKSNRRYVASTANGEFFFGRMDLVGKGAHFLAICELDKYENETIDDVRQEAEKRIEYRQRDLNQALRNNTDNVEYRQKLLDAAKKLATDENIELVYKSNKEWAKSRKKGLEIVYY